MSETPEFFTPLTEDSTVRLEFNRTDVVVVRGDIDQRGLGLKAIVTIYGIEFAVFGKACSLPRCQCDARIVLRGDQA